MKELLAANRAFDRRALSRWNCCSPALAVHGWNRYIPSCWWFLISVSLIWSPI